MSDGHSPPTSSPDWPPGRDEALRRFQEFLPRAGRHYGDLRNHDFGPLDRTNVSTLSPYLRCRLLREDEVVAATLARHGERAADAFLREVCWRTYWKGWLQLRPSVWEDYLRALDVAFRAMDGDRGLRDRWEAATSGRSGIACLDAWARELSDLGYLHNHARMWFASLWIFTLGLPWVLGADFFMRHLLDGDPASNTLSWRWVAGIQTSGKTYLATAENIARFTGGRFRPEEPLAGSAAPVGAPPAPRPRPLPSRDLPGRGRAGILLSEEDLHAESWPIGAGAVVAVARLSPTEGRSHLPLAPMVGEFTDGALADGLRRASGHFGIPPEPGPLVDPEAVASWAAGHGLERILTAEAPVGPTRGRLRAIARRLESDGVRLVRLRRDWDDRLWPLATAGFFPFKERLPRLWRELGLFGRIAVGDILPARTAEAGGGGA